MEIVHAFGKVIRQLRKEAKLTQEQLGFEADLRRTFVSLLELGQQQPTLTTIFKLAKALNVSASEIVRLIENELNSEGA
ncbi:transcriptional repressor DicA [mine drainage metagenome]|uniref:Transcriptional repressor DicA n=1 Tax=mine drainage metagenome TaxID=410659 RepID=A0A1J5SX44_9ZZZZ